MGSRARQTIRIRVKRGSTNGPMKTCGTCGGTGIVKNNSGGKGK